MYCSKAQQLLKSLNRDHCIDPVPKYNQEQVDEVINEMMTLYNLNHEAIERADPSEHMAILVRHEALMRNKRCLLAYHNERLERLKKLRWDFGTVLPDSITKCLSPSEMEWFNKYSQNLSSYMSSLAMGRGLDLTRHRRPPWKLYVQVRVLKELGQYELDDGLKVYFSKGSTHFLPLSSVENLIHQGVLEYQDSFTS